MPAPLRAWFRLALLLAILIATVETFLLLGIVTPVAIQGSSMAPGMLGPHIRVDCPSCELEFPVGGDQLPGAWPLVCPDCRHAFRGPSTAPLRPGRRVWVDRTRYLYQPPRRSEVVVFRCPDKPTSLCVKRVLGLPGETVDFSRGDLTINGQVYRKSLDEQLQLRQLVHRQRPALRLWQSETGAWTWRNETWNHNTRETGRLQFVPASAVVTDDLGVNQRASRQPNRVTDLMISCDADFSGGANLELIATFPDGTSQTASAPVHTPRRATSTQIVWSLFDRQSLLSVDGTIERCEPSDTPWPGPPQLAIEASGGVTLRNLTVWRDVYRHTRPVDRWPAAGVTLGEREYFVAGDNVAISSDSRNWFPHALPQRLIVGAPIR